MPAVPLIAAGVAVAGSVAAANKSAKASRESANIQANSAADANRSQKDMFDISRGDSLKQYEQSRADYAPLREQLAPSVYGIADLMGLKGGRPDGYVAYDYTKTPGYESRMEEGEKAINRAAAARGNFNSGATLKSLMRFNSNLASDEFTNSYNRLANLAGLGQTGVSNTASLGAQNASNLANLGSNYANQYGANTMGAGNAQAAGIVGASNAYASGLSGVAGAIGKGFDSYNAKAKDVPDYGGQGYWGGISAPSANSSVGGYGLSSGGSGLGVSGSSSFGSNLYPNPGVG